MTLRIAFCGPNLELNESLSHVVKDLIYSEELDFVEVPNSLMKVMETTGWELHKFEGHNVDWMNLWSNSLRRLSLESLRDTDVVVSSTCGIDSVCLQAAWVAEQVEKSKMGMALVDVAGMPLIDEEASYINRSGAVLQVLLNSTEEEVVDYWDFVYAVFPVVVGMSEAKAPLMVQYKDFASSVPAFQSLVTLPDHEDAAVDALKNERDKWKSKLASS